MKLCIDCKHHFIECSCSNMCHRDTYKNLVNGEENYVFRVCAVERISKSESTCNAEGKFFEPKPVKVSFWKRIFG